MNTTQIKDLMTKNIIGIDSNDSVISASEIMINNNIGSVIVFDGSNPVGIITERDIVNKVIDDCGNLCDAKAIDIATKDLITLNTTNSVILPITYIVIKDRIIVREI